MTKDAPLCDRYLSFLRSAVDPRQITRYAKKLARENGIEIVDNNMLNKAKPTLFVNKNRCFCFFIPGARPVTDGFNIITTHIDTPHLDLKPNPDMPVVANMKMLKLHKYGGVKNYGYLGIPLNLKVGAEEFTLVIPDDVPDKALDNKAHRFFKAKDHKATLSCENQSYLAALSCAAHISSQDLTFSEEGLYPGYEPRYVGFGKRLMGSSGQDNRSSVFCALIAAIAFKDMNPRRNTVFVFFDREEIGSFGLCGARSTWLRSLLSAIVCVSSQTDSISVINRSLSRSFCFNFDTTEGISPISSFEEVFDYDCCDNGHDTVRNSATIGSGVCIEKYPITSLDSLAQVRRLSTMHNVDVQYGLFGISTRIEGGGTLLQYVLNLIGCDGFDLGIPLLSMHSPYELASCSDLCSMYNFMTNIIPDFE